MEENNTEIIDVGPTPEVDETVVSASGVADTSLPNEEIQKAPEGQEVIDKVEFERNQAEHFKKLRYAKDLVTKERDDALRRLQEIEATQKSNLHKEEEEEDYEVNLAPDDLAEGKHLNKFSKKIKKLEEKIKHYQQETSAVSTEAKLKFEYPDFDKIVCKENVESLRLAYPEIASTINESSDLYSKAVSAYQMIKKFGIHTEDTFKSDRIRVQENAAKPRPISSVSPQQGNSPLARANAFAGGLTDDLKKQLYREMLESTK